MAPIHRSLMVTVCAAAMVVASLSGTPAYLARAAPHAALAASGPITEYPLPGSPLPVGIATGSDGALWFAESYDDLVGRITTVGAVRDYRFPTLLGSFYIAAGPDQALWVTFPDTYCQHSKIGRITTTGLKRLYPIPGISCPNDITAGSDGALWFTDEVVDRGIGKIGRITTAGRVSEFAFALPNGLPTGAYPYKITAGPDGALWFTLFNSRFIGKITTAGQAAFFTTPALPAATVDALTTGPDGALWFTADGGNSGPTFGGPPAAVGRITTSGVVTLYTPFKASVSLPGIAAGPDGALWFTYNDTNTRPGEPSDAVGRITTSGVVTALTPTPTVSGLSIITAGPDGALWFTETTTVKGGQNAGGQIGRIAPP